MENKIHLCLFGLVRNATFEYNLPNKNVNVCFYGPNKKFDDKDVLLTEDEIIDSLKNNTISDNIKVKLNKKYDINKFKTILDDNDIEYLNHPSGSFQHPYRTLSMLYNIKNTLKLIESGNKEDIVILSRVDQSIGHINVELIEDILTQNDVIALPTSEKELYKDRFFIFKHKHINSFMGLYEDSISYLKHFYSDSEHIAKYGNTFNTPERVISYHFAKNNFKSEWNRESFKCHLKRHYTDAQKAKL